MLVKDIMSKNPVTVEKDASLFVARDLMKKNEINKLPVVDKAGLLVGIITAGDLNKALPSSATSLDMYELGYLLSKLTVEKVMAKSVKTTTKNEPVEEVARMMREYGINSLPVMEGDIIVGIITQSDLFDCFVQMFSSRKAGVRATLIATEKTGVIARLAMDIAVKNGNIVSIVTSNAKDTGHRKLTIKTTGISQDEFAQIISDAGCELEDIRSVC